MRKLNGDDLLLDDRIDIEGHESFVQQYNQECHEEDEVHKWWKANAD